MSDHGESRQDFASEFMTADRQFCADVAAADPGARADIWARWFAADGRQMVQRQMLQGRESIAALMDPAFTSPGYSLTWGPDQVVVSAAGDLGWTSGRYVSTSAGPDGPVQTEGRYLTIWRRQADGSLQVDLDTGVPDGE